MRKLRSTCLLIALTLASSISSLLRHAQAQPLTQSPTQGTDLTTSPSLVSEPLTSEPLTSEPLTSNTADLAQEVKVPPPGVNFYEQLFSAIVGIALGILGILATVLKNQRDKLAKNLERFFSPPPVSPDESFSSTLVLGIGGSGKTTVVNKITDDRKADPTRATDSFAISGIVFETPASQPEKRCRVFMADYVGQNLGSLIRGFILEQQQGESPLAYGFITSLVLVVDLVEPPPLAGDTSAPVPAISQARIAKNIAAWNEQALSAVFGLLTSRLQFVCLFINKTDLIQQPFDIIETEARRLYQPLHEELGKRSRGARFLVLVGSAEDGTALSELKSRLIHSSIPSKLLKERII